MDEEELVAWLVDREGVDWLVIGYPPVAKLGPGRWRVLEVVILRTVAMSKLHYVFDLAAHHDIPCPGYTFEYNLYEGHGSVRFPGISFSDDREP